MSIQSEITRIILYRDQSFSAVRNKGVVVPSNAVINDLPTYIGQIEQSGGGTIGVSQDSEGYIVLSSNAVPIATGISYSSDAAGGSIVEIQGINLANDTIVASALMSGYTAHDSTGSLIVGTYTIPSAVTILDDIRVTMETTATSSSKLNVQLSVPQNYYMLYFYADPMPTGPDANEYIALTWSKSKLPSYNSGSLEGTSNAILRPAGTVGTDSNLATFDDTTGILSLGGPYGHFMVGMTYRIVLLGIGT